MRIDGFHCVRWLLCPFYLGHLVFPKGHQLWLVRAPSRVASESANGSDVLRHSRAGLQILYSFWWIMAVKATGLFTEKPPTNRGLDFEPQSFVSQSKTG